MDISKAYRGAHAVCEQGNFEAISAISNDISQDLLYTHIDEQDNVVYRKRLPNDLKLTIEQVAPYQSRMEGIVVESTYNWYWLVDGLMEQGQTEYIGGPGSWHWLSNDLCR